MLLTILLGLGALLFVGLNQNSRAAAFPLRGLDVSHHQGDIDWGQVAAAGEHEFVWIKASEGGDWVDPKFADNWRAAQAAGLVVGAYHYFTLCTPGAEQAENFLNTITPLLDEGAGHKTLAPAVDLEFTGNCKERPPQAQFTAEVKGFLDAVQQRLGRRPVVYTTTSFARAYDNPTLRAYPRWIRSVFRAPPGEPGRDWQVWQFNDNRALPGVNGPVDENAAAVTLDQLTATSGT